MHNATHHSRHAGRAFLAILTIATTACGPVLDSKREAREDPSVGAAIYREMCNRVAVAADPTLVSPPAACISDVAPATTDAPRLIAIFNQRDRLIAETNAAMDGKVGSDTRAMLGKLLPLYDDNTMQDATRSLADWLGELQNDREALDALKVIAGREGYTQPDLTPGFLRVLMRFDGLGDLLQSSLEPVTTTTQGTVTLANALSVLGPELDGAFDESDDPTHTWFLVRDFLMKHDDALDDGNYRFIVQRDTTGTATGGGAAALSTPFPLAATTRAATDRRDRYGRLIDANGNPLFDYIDVEGTVLSGLIREAARIAKTSPGAIGQLGRLPASWLGPAKAVTTQYASGSVRFGGFDTTKSPLLEVVHAAAAIAKKDSLVPALKALELVAQQRPQAFAAGTSALARAAGRLREAPYVNMHLEDDTALAEELLELGVEVMRTPGLLEQVLNAMEDPRVAALGQNFAKHMTYKDLIDYDSRDFNRPPLGEMRTPVDRSMPDVRGNRSLFQRYIHLMHDADTPVCNKQGAVVKIGPASYPFWGGGYDECELNEISSHGAFYAQSIIGRAELVFKDQAVATVSTDSVIQLNTGIDGFGQYPTPQSLARFCMVPFNGFLSAMYDPVPTRDGVPLRNRHNGTIFVWELDDFYPHIAPLIQAFDDSGRIDLFMRSATVIHRHYDSRDTDFSQSDDPDGLDYAPQTGLVRFEPVLAEAFESNAFAGLGELLAALRSVTVNGVDGRTLVINLVRDLTLPERNAGLTTYSGRNTIIRNDGATQGALTPVLLLINALRRLDDALPDDATRDAFVDGNLGLIGGLLDGDGTNFASTRTAPLTAQVLGFLRERIEAHRNAGDLIAWTGTFERRFIETMDQPLVQTLAPLLELMASTREARLALDEVIIHLADEEASVEAYTSTIQALADGMQLLDDEATLRPLARAFVTAADPKSGMLMKSTVLLQAIASRDVARALPQLFDALVLHPARRKTDETPVEALFDIVMDVNRVKPGATTPRTTSDYANVIGIVREFLGDDERGLERLYEIIANR